MKTLEGLAINLVGEPSGLPWEGRALPYQELQRNRATEPDVLGLVHHTHATAPELFQNAVVRNRLADHARLQVTGYPKVDGSLPLPFDFPSVGQLFTASCLLPATVTLVKRF